MTGFLVDPADPLETQNDKLRRIADALMHRVEQKTDNAGIAYAQFERAALLEGVVQKRTQDLERTLDLLHESNRHLALASAEAETARANLHEAIESVQEGFALFDPEEKLVLFNSRFCRDFDDVAGRLRPGMAFRDYIGLIAQSARLDLPQDQTGQDWFQGRMGQHHQDHSVFNVQLTGQRWLQVNEHRTDRGGTVILQTDVTDAIRTERAEHDRIFRATLDHLNQGVCIFDHGRKLIGWNQRMYSILGLPLDRSFLGQQVSELMRALQGQLRFPPHFPGHRFLDWARTSTGRTPVAFEMTTARDRTLAVFAREMPNGGFVVSFTDVTAERDAARALEQMNEALETRVTERTKELNVALKEAERANATKSRFVAAASHDLLQPLSAAKLFVNSLTERLDDPDAVAILRKAEVAMAGAEEIIDALLDISRLDSGKAVFDVKPVGLQALLHPLIEQMRPLAAAKGLELRAVPTTLTVRSDPGYLRRILQNLIGNAIRYTDAGRVLVGVRRNGGSARVEVWDTGRGIPEADQGAVFQEFRRLDPGGPVQGLGLGLAIVDRACAALEHPLSLWSAPGRGSCFSFNLPIHAAAGPSPADVPRAEAAPLPPNLLVLLVENDPQLSQAIELMFEDWDVDAISASSGEEALALLEEIDIVPDALVLDYHLGDGIDGIDLCTAIRTRYGPVPACIISAERSATLRERIVDAGLELIPKPLDRARLRRAIAAATMRD